MNYFLDHENIIQRKLWRWTISWTIQSLVFTVSGKKCYCSAYLYWKKSFIVKLQESPLSQFNSLLKYHHVRLETWKIWKNKTIFPSWTLLRVMWYIYSSLQIKYIKWMQHCAPNKKFYWTWKFLLKYYQTHLPFCHLTIYESLTSSGPVMNFSTSGKFKMIKSLWHKSKK